MTVLINVHLICHAQQDNKFRQSAFLIGGEMWGQMQNRKYDIHHESIFHFNCDMNLGYFLTNNDLILIRPGIIIDRLNSLSYNYRENVSAFNAELSYRRYLFQSFFTGIFMGFERKASNIFVVSETIDKDKVIKLGFEIGYTHLIKKNVAIEFNIFYAYNNIRFERESIEIYNYWKVGTKIGINYLFNIKKSD